MTKPESKPWKEARLSAAGFIYVREELRCLPVADTIAKLARDLGAHASRTIFSLPANMARAEYVSEAIRGVVHDVGDLLRNGKSIPDAGVGIVRYESSNSRQFAPNEVPLLRNPQIAPGSLIGYIHVVGAYHTKPEAQIGCLDLDNHLEYRYDARALV
jgi:hypothetical protein